jgi:hypothetical protein
VSAARAQQEAYPEELIVEVLYPPYVVSPALFAYEKSGRYYLPVLELAEQYEFFIEAEIDRGYLSGWSLDEQNSFSIDVPRGELIINGQREALSSSAVLPFEDVATDDFYVQVELLDRIWPLDFNFSLSTLSVISEAEEGVVLPFEERLARQKRQEQAMTRKAEQDKHKNYKFVKNLYKLFSKPVIDIQTRYLYDHDQRELTGSNTISGSQQLGYSFAQFAGAYQYDERGRIIRPDSIRLKFERETIEGQPLPLDLEKIEAGDISIQNRDLISNGVGGRGAYVSSFKDKRQTEFDTITVEGTAPAGWEIELYNNRNLIEFGVVDELGEYRFEDVALEYGNNRVRVVLYGPQGQQREIIENYTFSGNMLPPGEVNYDIGFVDANRPFIYLDNKPRSTPRGVAANAEIAYGLGQNVTTFATLGTLPENIKLETEDKQYMTAGAIVSGLGMIGQVEGYKQFGGGNALDLRLNTNLAGVNLNLRSSFFNDFESPDTGYDSTAKRFEAQGRLSTSIGTPLGSLGLKLNVLHTEDISGFVRSTFDTFQSIGRGGLRLSNSTTTRVVNEIHDATTGGVDLTANLDAFTVRGGFNYNLHPIAELNNFTSELRYAPEDKPYQGSVNFSHGFLTTLSTIGAQIGYDFGSMLGSIGATYKEKQGWEFSLRSSTSLHPYTEDGSYELSSKSKRRVAPVSGLVFMDYDNNGVFSEGDEYLEGARLLVDGKKTEEISGADGRVVTERGGAFRSVNIELDESSLVDPYYVPAVKGYRTALLPGSVPTFNFPIVETGSIDGTVYKDSDGSAVQGMRIQIVDKDGVVISETETAYDGFYIFEFIPPGTYTVRADPSYGVNVPPATVTVASEELFAFGIDLLLIEQAAEAEAAANADGESGGVAQMHHAPAANGTLLQPAPEPSPSDNAVVEVEDVRVGEYSDKGRLVLDLSESTPYNITVTNGGSSVVIDVPDAAWGASAASGIINAPVIQSYEYKALDGSGVRLIIHVNGKAVVAENGILKPNETYKNYRLYVDLAKR